MHWNWNIEQILWALVLAGHLVLLIVLLGQDRIRRFPWFSAGITLSAITLIANHLLQGKLTTVAFYWQSYTGVSICQIVGIGVLIELCRKVFGNKSAPAILKSRGWIGGAMVTIAIAAAIVWYWGPWPTLAAIKAQPEQTPLLLDVLFALKMQLFVAILTVEVALLMRVFGRRFGSSGRSHAQQIAIGLSTNALGFLTVQGISTAISRNFHPTTRAEYERTLKMISHIENGRTALWLLVLIWWIYWLWRNDPGTTDVAELAEFEPVPAMHAAAALELPDTEPPVDLDGRP